MLPMLMLLLSETREHWSLLAELCSEGVISHSTFQQQGLPVTGSGVA